MVEWWADLSLMVKQIFTQTNASRPLANRHRFQHSTQANNCKCWTSVNRGSRGKHECMKTNVLDTFAHNLAEFCLYAKKHTFQPFTSMHCMCCIVYLSFCVLCPFHVFLCGAERGLYCSLYTKFWSHDSREWDWDFICVYISFGLFQLC